MKKLLALLSSLLIAGIAAAAVNINTATLEELDALPGLGPVKAQAVIDYRKQNGAFKTKEDLKQVNGIGDKTFADLEGKISLSGTTKIDWDMSKKATEIAPPAAKVRTNTSKKTEEKVTAAIEDKKAKLEEPKKAADKVTASVDDKKTKAEEKKAKAEEKKVKAETEKKKKEEDAKITKDAEKAAKDATRKAKAEKSAATKEKSKTDSPR